MRGERSQRRRVGARRDSALRARVDPIAICRAAALAWRCVERDTAGVRIATAQDRRFAREFMARADRAYRRGNYHRAWRDYNDAVPSYPHVRGFLMAADVGQRSWLQYGERHRRATGGCAIRRENYISQLDSDLTFRTRVGLVLAARTPPRDAAEATLRRRVAAQAVCLEEIRRDYQPLPDATCVDAKRLAACLGPPLLR